jgi:hypothetical protein
MAIETSQGLLVAGLLAERIGTTLPGRRRATS